jgi:hypothetical protein
MIRLQGLMSQRRRLETGLAVVILAVAGCATGDGGAGGEWTRDYVSTPGRVFEASLDALEDIDFYVERSDADRGRIVARSSARRADLEASLFVDVRAKGDRTRVDVMAQSQGMEDGRSPVQVSGAVRDFFTSLDRRLEGRGD